MPGTPEICLLRDNAASQVGGRERTDPPVILNSLCARTERSLCARTERGHLMLQEQLTGMAEQLGENVPMKVMNLEFGLLTRVGASTRMWVPK